LRVEQDPTASSTSRAASTFSSFRIQKPTVARELGVFDFTYLCGNREWDSLIRAEISKFRDSLIADLNSLQGRKKFPVRVRRELARKAPVLCAFLLRLTHSRASNR
jgi:hypothetical protein